jgi:hypothetical protein
MRRQSEARDTIRISALFCILLVKHIIAAKVKRIPGATHPCQIEIMVCYCCHSSQAEMNINITISNTNALQSIYVAIYLQLILNLALKAKRLL